MRWGLMTGMWPQDIFCTIVGSLMFLQYSKHSIGYVYIWKLTDNQLVKVAFFIKNYLSDHALTNPWRSCVSLLSGENSCFAQIVPHYKRACLLSHCNIDDYLFFWSFLHSNILFRPCLLPMLLCHTLKLNIYSALLGNQSFHPYYVTYWS